MTELERPGSPHNGEMKDFDEFLAMYESGAIAEEYNAKLQEFCEGKTDFELVVKQPQFAMLFLLRKYHEWLHS